MALTRETIFAHRLHRQRLIDPLRSRKDYLDLFSQLQPVSPIHFSYPGSPPGLVHRTTFDAIAEADRHRPDRTLVKGRFLGGGIGYVLGDDLATYATAFRKPIKELNPNQELVLEIMREVGPLAPRQIKEESQHWEDPGLLNKEIMPALHRLQQAFLVFEDQVDTDWERDWNDFAAEWPDIDLEAMAWEKAAAEVLKRLIKSQVFLTLEQIKDGSGFSLRALKSLLSEQEKLGALIPAKVETLGPGWHCPEDADLESAIPEPSVFMLHKADPLAKTHTSELKRRFGNHETLQYLLIDGTFQGAVLGHWRIGPHDVEDILVELLAKERKRRKQAVLEAVSWRYSPPNHHILQYDGKKV